MATFEVVGGNQLKGEIIPQGAKNEALQVLCAVLLTAEPVTIHHLPDIVDVNKLIELLANLGVEVEYLGEKPQGRTYRFTAGHINLEYLETEDFRKKAGALRGSIMILGPLLARFGKSKIPKPGGDKIGRRRLDTHFLGFEKLGARFVYDPDNNFYYIDAKELKGTYIFIRRSLCYGYSECYYDCCFSKRANYYL